MEPILAVAEMRKVDSESTADIDALMLAAGYGVALSAVKLGVGYGSRVEVIAGRGNNGGDGYIAARYLSRRGALVTVHQVAAPESGTAADRALRQALAGGVKVIPIGMPTSCDLVIDAFAGTGFRGELPPDVEAWTYTPHPVLSVDVPSGMDGDTGTASGVAFTADRTATFHRYKPGHFLGEGPELCGAVDLYDIGLEGGIPAMALMTESDIALRRRGRRAHKWNVGSVATIGGVPGLTGAALFAARAAIAAGAGASVLLTTGANEAAYAATAPDIPQMLGSETSSWRNHASEVLGLIDRCDALVMGPGLDPVSPEFVERILTGFEGTIVLDAGALNALPSLDLLQAREHATILTPHHGEFARLTDREPNAETARWLADATHSVIVLKGNPTVVVGDRSTIVDRGGPELATIGTGDVLAGMIGAFAARGLDAEQAACTAAYLHGTAGRAIAVQTLITPQRLINAVAKVVRTHEYDGGTEQDAPLMD